MKKIFIMIALCITTGTVLGQTKKAFLKAAQSAVEEDNHYAAFIYYQEVLEFNENDPDIIFQTAEAARKYNAYEVAAEYYALLVDSLVVDSLYPTASFRLGEMKQRLGKFDQAINYYNMYITEHGGNDSYLDTLAQNGMDNSIWADLRLMNPDKSAEISLVDEVNTNYSDFGAIHIDDALYYSSMQHEQTGGEYKPSRSISKIHKLENDSISILDSDINKTDSLVAHTSFNKDKSEVYYTICDFVTASEIRCDLYKSKVDENGNFGPQIKLPNAVNVDSFTNTHPHIAFDKERQLEVLYFVSDRPGGKGKLDIYYSVLNENGAYSEARNLGALNTEENDVTPFFNSNQNKLYFSSDGRRSLGGYDIYYAKKQEDEWGSVESLRPPMNSSFHDLYYTVDEIEGEGHFSSNRSSSAYLDPTNKACCFDIYNVVYDEVIIDLNVITYDSYTKSPLLEATVKLLDAESGDLIHSVYSEKDSSHVFNLKRGRTYTIVADREHYNTATVEISTTDITKSEQLIERLFLNTDKMQLAVFAFNDRTKEELNGATVKIIDITDPTNPIFLETNEMSNNFHAYLELGKKYKIEAAKFGFVKATEIVDLTHVKEPGLIKKDMYLDVFDIENYLPVFVYFDNDYPNPESKATTSNDIYGQLYNDYVYQKPNFIKKVAKHMSHDIKAQAELDVAAFFEGDVAGGYETLKRFMRALKKELGLGRSLEIAIKGYTSPLAETKYNLALGQRRVSSVKNEILAYEGGIFRPYVESGKLKLIDISFGEEKAPKYISDKKSDLIGSVYSVGASRERKVEIISIKDQK